jgi:hypothetical protein
MVRSFAALLAVAAVRVAAQTETTTSELPWPTDNLPTYNGTGPTMLRFGCHQLVIDRIDPLVAPGQVPSHHQHQVVGGDAFNPTLPYTDLSAISSCTTCSYSEDRSMYWTANLYFRARNGSYKRVKQIPNYSDIFTHDTFINRTNGGMTVYYVSPGQNQVTAFPPGFRMFVGDAMLRSPPSSPYNLSTQNCYRCFTGPDFGGDIYRPCTDPAVDTMHLPDKPCWGIRSNILFPT